MFQNSCKYYVMTVTCYILFRKKKSSLYGTLVTEPLLLYLGVVPQDSKRPVTLNESEQKSRILKKDSNLTVGVYYFLRKTFTVYILITGF